MNINEIEIEIIEILKTLPEESARLDYKRDNYQNTFEYKKELLKDIMAMANGCEYNGKTKYIIIGVDEDKTKHNYSLYGIDKKTFRDESEYQELFKKIKPNPEVSVGTLEFNGKCFGYYAINTEIDQRPYFLIDEYSDKDTIKNSEEYKKIKDAIDRCDNLKEQNQKEYNKLRTRVLEISINENIMPAETMYYRSGTSNHEMTKEELINIVKQQNLYNLTNKGIAIKFLLIGNVNERNFREVEFVSNFLGVDQMEWSHILYEVNRNGYINIKRLNGIWNVKNKKQELLKRKEEFTNADIQRIKTILNEYYKNDYYKEISKDFINSIFKSLKIIMDNYEKFKNIDNIQNDISEFVYLTMDNILDSNGITGTYELLNQLMLIDKEKVLCIIYGETEKYIEDEEKDNKFNGKIGKIILESLIYNFDENEIIEIKNISKLLLFNYNYKTKYMFDTVIWNRINENTKIKFLKEMIYIDYELKTGIVMEKIMSGINQQCNCEYIELLKDILKNKPEKIKDILEIIDLYQKEDYKKIIYIIENNSNICEEIKKIKLTDINMEAKTYIVDDSDKISKLVYLDETEKNMIMLLTPNYHIEHIKILEKYFNKNLEKNLKTLIEMRRSKKYIGYALANIKLNKNIEKQILSFKNKEEYNTIYKEYVYAKYINKEQIDIDNNYIKQLSEEFKKDNNIILASKYNEEEKILELRKYLKDTLKLDFEKMKKFSEKIYKKEYIGIALAGLKIDEKMEKQIEELLNTKEYSKITQGYLEKKYENKNEELPENSYICYDDINKLSLDEINKYYSYDEIIEMINYNIINRKNMNLNIEKIIDWINKNEKVNEFKRHNDILNIIYLLEENKFDEKEVLKIERKYFWELIEKDKLTYLKKEIFKNPKFFVNLISEKIQADNIEISEIVENINCLIGTTRQSKTKEKYEEDKKWFKKVIKESNKLEPKYVRKINMVLGGLLVYIRDKENSEKISVNIKRTLESNRAMIKGYTNELFMQYLRKKFSLEDILELEKDTKKYENLNVEIKSLKYKIINNNDYRKMKDRVINERLEYIIF